MKRIKTLESTEKSTNTAIYEGKEVTIITIFTDINVAMIENKDGEILDVSASLIKIKNS